MALRRRGSSADDASSGPFVLMAAAETTLQVGRGVGSARRRPSLPVGATLTPCGVPSACVKPPGCRSTVAESRFGKAATADSHRRGTSISSRCGYTSDDTMRIGNDASIDKHRSIAREVPVVTVRFRTSPWILRTGRGSSPVVRNGALELKHWSRS